VSRASTANLPCALCHGMPFAPPPLSPPTLALSTQHARTRRSVAPAARVCALLRAAAFCTSAGGVRLTDRVYASVQINAGAEALEGEEFGDDNFDFDEVDEI